MIFCPSEGNGARMVRKKYVVSLPKYGYKYPKYEGLRLAMPHFTYTFPFRFIACS